MSCIVWNPNILSVFATANRWTLPDSDKDTGYVDVDWIQLAQDMIQWHALVNTVMKFGVS
jgi:hypothetical protein